jgi:hypothetical protein
MNWHTIFGIIMIIIAVFLLWHMIKNKPRGAI